MLLEEVQGGGSPWQALAPGDDAGCQHWLELLLGGLFLGTKQRPGVAAPWPGVIGLEVFHPMVGGELGVAREVYCTNVGKFLEKAGQLGLHADIVDVGVIGWVSRCQFVSGTGTYNFQQASK